MIASEKNVYYDLFMPLILSIFTTLFSLLFWQSFNFFNLIIAYCSSFLFIYAGTKIFQKRELKSHLIFIFSFYIGLYFNTFMLSRFQTEKNYIDVYYFFTGPILFYLVLYFFENKSIKTIKYRKRLININVLYLIFLSSYILLKLYISSLVGWRISSFDNSNFLQSGSLYTVSGYSGLAAILQWMLVIFSLNTKRRYAIIGIIAIIIFSYLHVKRGDILRVALFYFIFYSFRIFKLSKSIRLKSNFNNTFKIVVMLVLLLLVFVYLGNIREELRGNTEAVLSNNIGIDNAPAYLSWFYGYIPINYEVVRFYFNTSPTNYPHALLKTIISPDSEVLNSEHSINGFNASTILTSFIKDYGEFYFLEMILFAFVIGLLIKQAKKQQFLGCYVFISMILGYSFFGNYFEVRSMFLPILASLIIFPYVETGKNTKIREEYF